MQKAAQQKENSIFLSKAHAQLGSCPMLMFRVIIANDFLQRLICASLRAVLACISTETTSPRRTKLMSP